MKKTALLIFLSLFVAHLTCFPQFKRIGLKAGANLTNVRVTDGEFAQLIDQSVFDQVVGANVGFLNQFSGNNVFVTDVGFFYSLKGCKDDSFKLRMNYIQIPLVFKIRLPIAGPVALQGGFGPYVSYCFLGRETVGNVTDENILSWRSKNKDSFFESELKPYNPWDAGMIFDFDIEVGLPNDKTLLIGFNYEMGILKISNEWEIIPEQYANPALKNQAFTFNISYLFNLRKKENDNK